MINKKRRGLGNLGVDILLSAVSPREAGLPQDDLLKMLPIEAICRGRYQPRTQIDPEALQTLADSIRAQGLVQPVVVRAIAQGYELIAGERRWRAAQLAGLAEIPALIKDLPDQAAAAVALIENIQREDLNALEEAGAFQRLIDEFGLTHQQVAEAVGRSRAAVSNGLRLLELAEPVKALIHQGEIEMGHARALLALDSAQQVIAARTVIKHRLSVRETEHYVRRLLNAKARVRVQVSKDPDVARLEQSVSDKLGAQVEIEHSKVGRGRLVIHYHSLEELDGILAHIQ